MVESNTTYHDPSCLSLLNAMIFGICKTLWEFSILASMCENQNKKTENFFVEDFSENRASRGVRNRKLIEWDSAQLDAMEFGNILKKNFWGELF